MKVKLSLLLLVVGSMLIVVPSGFGQTGVAGKWTGELSAADGHGVAQPITVELKLAGEALTGTVAEGALEARPIQAATVAGNNVTFRTTRNLGGADINVNWKGEVKGDDLALSREIGPAPAEAAAGRGGGGAGGGRGGAGAAGGRGGAAGGRGGAAPAAGAAAPAAAAPIPPVPGADGAAAAGGGRGAGGRGGAPAAAGGAAGGGQGGGRGGAAAAPPPGPTVALTLHRAK